MSAVPTAAVPSPSRTELRSPARTCGVQNSRRWRSVSVVCTGYFSMNMVPVNASTGSTNSSAVSAHSRSAHRSRRGFSGGSAGRRAAETTHRRGASSSKTEEQSAGISSRSPMTQPRPKSSWPTTLLYMTEASVLTLPPTASGIP